MYKRRIHSTHLLLTLKQYEKVRAEAFRRRTTISAIVREVIDKHLCKEKEEYERDNGE
jgi:hypothetical protein